MFSLLTIWSKDSKIHIRSNKVVLFSVRPKSMENMNKKRVIQIAMIVCAVLLLLLLFANLFKVFGVEQVVPLSTTRILIYESGLMLILLFLGLLQSGAKAFMFRKRKSKKQSGVSAKYLQSIVGEKVVVTTFVEVFSGVLVETDGDWIKIKDGDMRPTVHILRTDMVLSILVK